MEKINVSHSHVANIITETTCSPYFTMGTIVTWKNTSFSSVQMSAILFLTCVNYSATTDFISKNVQHKNI